MTSAVETNEPESTASGPQIDGLCDYASVWFDLLRIVQLLDRRAELPAFTDEAPVLFTRAALWDSAVAAYGRCFNTGSRQTSTAKFVKRLPSELQACHQQIMRARNQEVAHHDQDRQNQVLASAVFDEAGAVLGVRLRIFPQIEPRTEPPFRELVRQLASLIEEKIYQLERQIVSTLDVARLSETAAPHDPQAHPLGPLRVTYEAWMP